MTQPDTLFLSRLLLSSPRVTLRVRMNIKRGLERVSAVWWGFWALVCLVVLVFELFGEGPLAERFFVGLASVSAGGAIYLAHRLTCWVIAGFFAPPDIDQS